MLRGAFAGVYGEFTCHSADKSLWIERVGRLLYQGGMMQTEEVKIFNRQIELLKFPEEKENKLNVWFNYFEDESWEEAGWDREKLRFTSGEIGWKQFYLVVAAVYMLEEKMSQTPCLMEVDEECGPMASSLKWINGVLGTKFTHRNRQDCWGMYELLRKHETKGHRARLGEKTVSCERLMGFLPRGTEENVFDMVAYEVVEGGYEEYRKKLAQCSLNENKTDVKENTNSEDDECNKSNEKKDNASSNVITCFSILNHLGRNIDRVYIKSKRTQEKFVSDYLEFLKDPKEAMHSGRVSNDWGILLISSLFVKPQVMIKVLAEKFGLDFWKLWEEANITKEIKEIEEARKAFLPEYTISKPMTTEEYLHIDADHRLLYWSEGGNVVLSNEMRLWFDKLKRMYKRAIQTEVISAAEGVGGLYGKTPSMIIRLMDGAKNASDIYWRIYIMNDTFYELIEHEAEAEYRALWRVFEELVEDNKAKATQIAERAAQTPIYGEWRYMPLEMKYNPQRMEIKRYIALLGNKDLRMKVLGI